MAIGNVSALVKPTIAARASAPALPASITYDDFYAYMPAHTYVFVPTREMWPAASLDARLPPQLETDEDGRPVMGASGQRRLKASKWLDRHRPIEQMTWAPGDPLVIEDRLVAEGGWIQKAGCRCFNLYRPPPLMLGEAAQASPWVDHVRYVYPDDADHVLAWLAHRVQCPHEKINHALVLGGSPGIGKDTILEPVSAAIGAWNLAEVSATALLGRFNGFLKSIILRVSEARDLGDIDRYAFYERSKLYTAAPPDILRVDEKNLREYPIRNVCGVLITTNYKTNGLYLPADDRRHYVAWSELTPADADPDYFTALYQWFAAGGLGHVAAYLRAYPLDEFNSKAPPPKTEAFWAIVDAGRAPEDAELADVLTRLGQPEAVTVTDLAALPTDTVLANYLTDRKNSRQIPHRLEACGYLASRNPWAKDGLWVIHGRRCVIYVLASLTPIDRQRAAKTLAER